MKVPLKINPQVDLDLVEMLGSIERYTAEIFFSTFPCYSTPFEGTTTKLCSTTTFGSHTTNSKDYMDLFNNLLHIGKITFNNTIICVQHCILLLLVHLSHSHWNSAYRTLFLLLMFPIHYIQLRIYTHTLKSYYLHFHIM